jgi:hypothetical protein
VIIIGGSGFVFAVIVIVSALVGIVIVQTMIVLSFQSGAYIIGYGMLLALAVVVL